MIAACAEQLAAQPHLAVLLAHFQVNIQAEQAAPQGSGAGPTALRRTSRQACCQEAFPVLVLSMPSPVVTRSRWSAPSV